MVEASSVIARTPEVCTVVPAAIGLVVVRPCEVEEARIRIRDVDTELPPASAGIDGAEEIVDTHEPCVLRTVQYPPQVIVADVEHVVIIVHGPCISPYHIVHDITGVVDEVVIDFENIVVLCSRQIQLVGHLVGEEAGLCADFACTHGRHTHAAHGSHSDGK